MIQHNGLCIFLSAVLIASVYGQSCTKTVDDCLNSPGFKKLSTGDPSYYCEQGSKTVADAQNCLRGCGFPEDNDYLVKQKKDINEFCADRNDDCPNVTDTFVAQTRCYDPYGGIDSIVANITSAFESGATDFSKYCNPLYWGRTCQRNQTCQVNANLESSLITNQVALGLAICGSEDLKRLLPNIEQSTGCSVGNDMNAKINNRCNIACNAADATNETYFCELLQKQATCLETETAGCTAAQRQYVKPRLNSYAVANRYLNCKIKFNGITVKHSGKVIDYSRLINLCGFWDTIEPLIFISLQLLLNYETPYLQQFCSNINDKDSLIAVCRNSFLAAATPQFKLLSRTEDDLNSVSTDFNPSIGGFPVDAYGMTYIFDDLPAGCPDVAKPLQWSQGICVPAADQTTKAAGPMTKAKTTPPKVSVTGGGEPVTRAPAEDYIKGSTIINGENGNSASSVVISAVLLLVSAGLGLINM